MHKTNTLLKGEYEMTKIEFTEIKNEVLNGHVGDFWTGVGIGVTIIAGGVAVLT